MRSVFWIYQFLLLLLLPIVVIFCLVTKKGRIRLQERLGFWHLPKGEYVWFHGASVGEIRGLSPIIEETKKAFPHVLILLTMTSPNGFSVKTLADESRLFPFDLEIFYQLAFSGADIRAAVSGETEIWPGFLSFLRKKAIPMYWINARISPKTAPWYLRLKDFLRRALSLVRWVAAADPTSKKYLEELGLSPVEFLGNTKYDAMKMPELSMIEKAKALLLPLPVITFGSIRVGEEAIFFDAIKAVRDTQYVLVPRQMQEVLYFVKKVREAGFEPVLRSENRPLTSAKEILIVDTLGELMSWYAVSSVSIVGGTFVPIGGHNPLEPALCGKPIVLGPYTSTVQEIVGELLAQEACLQVATSDALYKALINPSLPAYGERAQQIAYGHQGATERVWEKLQPLLKGVLA